MKKLLLTSFAAAVFLQGKAQTFTHAPVAVTGFTADVIADGTGSASVSTTADVDGGNYTFVAQNFVNPTGASPTSFLPANGTINSAVTSGLPFQLQPYTGNNSLRLTTAANSGTLTFTTPRTADKLTVLVTTAYPSTFTATVNFTDATTQDFTGNSIPNWFDGANPAIQGISRVLRTTNAIENSATNPRMYQYSLVLSAANAAKTIQSITFTKTTTVATEILHVFAVTASNAIPNDAGISAITAPTSPVAPNVSVPVTVTVKNFGANPLASATLGFSVDGTTVVNNYAFTASPALATNGVATAVPIGNFAFPAGNHKIKAWTSLPNGVADGGAGNDTLSVNVISCSALSGNYTIDKNSPGTATNFQSFATAVQTLVSCGVGGPVTISVAPNTGPYTEQVILPAIAGTSATNTITFEGNSNTLSVNPVSGTPGMITLDGADYVKINNFNLLLPATSTTGCGIMLKNTADNNIITNNIFSLPLTATSSAVNGIIIGTGGTGTGSNGSNNLIQNNTINGGYYGIAMNGNTSGNTGAVNNQVLGNLIKDFHYCGISLNYTTGTLVEGNDISRPTRSVSASTIYGIQLIGTTAQNNRLSKNRLHNTHDAATTPSGTVYGFNITASGAVNLENIISNNLIYNLNNNGGSFYVFYNNGANHTHYFNNTLSADNPSISYGTLRGMYFGGTLTNVKFINNNFSLVSPATVKHAIYLTGTHTLVSDRNNLYIGSTGKIGFFSADKATIADWKTANTNAYDQNSVSVNPYFTNPAAGNLQPRSAHMDNIGQALTAVTEDITGAIRPATTPDAGAYEFTAIPADAGVSALVSPVSGCGLSNLETVTITVNNYGITTLTNIPVSYTLNGGVPVSENFSGPVAPGTSANYDFTAKADLSTPDTYTIVAQTALTPDGIADNNAVTKVINSIPLVSTYPYNQNFETTNGGWLASGTASTWAWGTPAKTIINAAASGTKAYVTNLTGQYAPNEKSQVTGPCFNFSTLTDPVIEMKIWWNSDFSKDGTVLQSSIDGGTTWQNVGVKGDPNNWFNDNTIDGAPGAQTAASAQGWTGRNSSTNGSGAWVTAKHDLTGLGGKTAVKLRIAFGADGSTQDEGFAFDDVMIYEKPVLDGSVTAISSPASACGLTNQETVAITVKNFGNATLSNIPVAFYVDGGAPVNEVVAGPVLPGATTSYTFTAKADLSAVGTHILVAKTKILGDILVTNDSTFKTITTIPVISTLPYTQGFENGNGGWLAGGVNASWELGTPAKPVINAAAAGTKSWITGLTANYNVNENSFVESPCFDFTNNAQPVIETKIWWQSEHSIDGTVLQSTIDGGATWQNVGAQGDPNNWYNDSTLNAAPGGQPATTAEGWTGRVISGTGSGAWVTAKHVLTGLGGQANVKLRFAFASDQAGQDDGFAFDEILVTDNGKNMAVNAVVPINKVCGLSAAEPITAVIQNQSSIALTGFTVSYTVNGGTPVTETFTGSLAAGATNNFTFAQTANLSASGSYTIVVTVTMAGDLEASNNSATYTISNATFAGLPPVFDFEPGGNGIAQLVKITKTRSAITEDAGATFGTTSTKGMILDGVDHASWTVPTGIVDPWASNPENFSAAYICFNPSGGAATDSLWLTFDLKQLYKGANANTNLRITVNGTQLGATFRPPFSGTPITWQKVKVDLFAYKNDPTIQIGLESSVKEEFANGTGTANLIDNIEIKRLLAQPVSGVKADKLAKQINVFPNPSTGTFNVSLENGIVYDLKVTDLSGKVILTQKAKGDAKLNLEGTAKGIYLLNVTSKNGTAVRKLIVE